MKMNYPIHVIVLVAATLTSSRDLRNKNYKSHFEILLIHNNDMHARFEETSQASGVCKPDDKNIDMCFGGFSRIANEVKQARHRATEGEGPPVIFLNAGDIYLGSSWYTIYKWKIAADFINALQPDVISLGNHEFDNGVTGLIPFLEHVTCPVVAANINLTKEPDLAAIRRLTQSHILNINGHRIGVIGYLTPDTKFLAVKNFVEYIDEVVALRREAEKLYRQGVNILIALGHSGYLTDIRIAREVEHIDLVVGGHSHTFLWNGTPPDIETPKGSYPTFVAQPSGRLVGIVQAYAFTKYLGKLLLTFDSRGEIVQYEGQPILLDSTIEQDEVVLSMVKEYRDKVKNVTDNIIGTMATDLDGKSCRTRECNLGNLITDAIIYKYASGYEGPFWTDAPIALISGGEIRSSISSRQKPGTITRGDLMEILPFDGYMVKVEINGSTLLSVLEHSVYRYYQKQHPGEFLQISGLKVEYDVNKEPGARVVNVHVRCGLCDTPAFQPLKKDNFYKILVTFYLSLGGNDYPMFLDKPSYPLSFDQQQATAEYIETHSPVNPIMEGRIVFLNSDSEKMSFPKIIRSIISFFKSI